jgi:hypothetical protein
VETANVLARNYVLTRSINNLMINLDLVNFLILKKPQPKG